MLQCYFGDNSTRGSRVGKTGEGGLSIYKKYCGRGCDRRSILKKTETSLLLEFSRYRLGYKAGRKVENIL